MGGHSDKLHIGTSGWHYNHWKGPFYPEDISPKDMLLFYKNHFHTTEINNSFYRLPQKTTLELWRNSVPAGFVFSLKGSRYITHMFDMPLNSGIQAGSLTALTRFWPKVGRPFASTIWPGGFPPRK